MSRVYTDLHIHSRYSRATSRSMTIPSIARFAAVKGLNIVGTGDFTHPDWMKELKKEMRKIQDSNLYTLKGTMQPQIYFLPTSEVNTVFTVSEKTKRIHHLILTPNLETGDQINDRLQIYGDLSRDGRPTLTMSAAELVEELMGVSRKNVVIPAHVWTPWFSLYGSKSGFDRIQDCYEDMTKHIFALETGLSSDPPMNWRWSALDDYALISNSDCHSPYPYRLGREANVLEIEAVTYENVIDAIRMKQTGHFKFTIETYPAYGKYHWTGHRKCNVTVPPWEARQFHERCPVCRRPLTRGVEDRVEDLADRPRGFQPENAVDYVHLLPLHEIIGASFGKETFRSPVVSQVYDSLVGVFGNEYAVLLDVPRDALEKIVDPSIAEAIIRVREDRIEIVPGYDGVYGKLNLTSNKTNTSPRQVTGQSRLEGYL